MPAYVGRSQTLTWGGASILGVREKGVDVSGEQIDITSDENSGWQTLLTTAGQNAVNVSISGVSKDRVLRNDFFAGNRTKTLALTYPDGSILSGTFFLANYKENNPYNDTATFDADFQSSGPVTWTPGVG